ncbi:MAG: CDP-archaeol synthase [Methyloceanibacter sp.]|uniref:CDP-archaeol synthase n=1 Tax=Methyloceanibacter sp. TaxID=1965321 RepID=UPI003D6D4632
MQPVLILQLLILMAVANGTPVFAKKILGGAYAWPLDGGAVLADGGPLFGPSKTIRGIVLSLLATILAAVLMGLGWRLGLVVALAAMAGDLTSSFVKRRLGYPPSAQAIGLDQVPEALFPLIAAGLLVPVTPLGIAAGTAIFFVGSLVVSRILFKLRLRDEPY